MDKAQSQVIKLKDFKPKGNGAKTDGKLAPQYILLIGCTKDDIKATAELMAKTGEACSLLHGTKVIGNHLGISQEKANKLDKLTERTEVSEDVKNLLRAIAEANKNLKSLEERIVANSRRYRSPKSDSIRNYFITAQGFADNCDSVDSASLIEQLKQCKDGFNGVVVVMRYPTRWTDESRKVTQSVVEVIGRDNLGQYGTLVLTDGDAFKENYEKDTLLEFRRYLLKNCKEPEFHKFIRYFKRNIMILDTELGDPGLNLIQLEEFFSYMDDRRFVVKQGNQK